jgi:hypothetical protein
VSVRIRLTFFTFLTLLASTLAPLGAQHVVIVGRVRDSVSAPVFGASVTFSIGLLDIATAVSDEVGGFRIESPIADSAMHLRASKAGFIDATIALPLARRDTTYSVVLTLQRSLVRLPVVNVVATRPRVRRSDAGSSSPGQNRASLDRDASASGDPSGDLASLLAITPGIILSAGSGQPEPTAFGLPPEANGITLNGIDAPPITFPRDGMLRQVRLATYDPKFGRFAGAQVSATLTCGCDFQTQSLRLTADQPLLSADARLGAATYRSQIVSGWLAGSSGEDGSAYSVVFQGTRRLSTSAGPSLLSDGTLATLNIPRSLLDRAEGAARSIGLEAASDGRRDAESNDASVIARLDILPGPRPTAPTTGTALYIVGSGAVNRALAPPPLTALGPAGLKSERTVGQLTAVYVPYLWDALSETKGSATFTERRTIPLTNMPKALVLASDSVSDAGALQLSFGGASQSAFTDRRFVGQLSNETQWSSLDGEHRYQLFGDVSVTHVSLDEDLNSSGSYFYRSITDLAENRPSQFVRFLGSVRATGMLSQMAFGASDIIVRRRADPGRATREGTTVQYGIRVDREAFSTAPALKTAVFSAFGRRADGAPSVVSLSPMLGVSVTRGVFRENAPGNGWIESDRHLITAGIRRYSGSLSPLMMLRGARETGLSTGVATLDCMGSAVIAPDWRALSRGIEQSATSCAQDGDARLGQLTSPVTLFHEHFAPTSSWRADGNWRVRSSAHWYLSMGGTLALNLGGIEAYDLNFDGRTKLSLRAEANRPVFVSGSDVVAQSGLVSSRGSRVHSDFGRVTELRSQLRTREQQLVFGAEWRTGEGEQASDLPDAADNSTLLRLNYTLAGGWAQSSGFSDATAGDPRQVEVGPLTLPRHTIQAIMYARLARWGSFSLSARVSSGQRFTPLVAGDFNGDGLLNDRAFVFQPGAGTHSADISTMTANHRCLAAQAGRVARVNSCKGDWSVTLGAASFSIEPTRIGLGKRGTFTVTANNLIEGLDHVIHGGGRIRGWGSMSRADPVLLYVRGFDPATEQFKYAINGKFGSSTSLRVPSPFRISLDVRLEVGRDLEERNIDTFLAYAERNGHLESEAKLTTLLKSWADPRSYADAVVLRHFRDSLALTQEQVDRLDAIERERKARTDSVYDALGRQMYQSLERGQRNAINAAWHREITAAIRAGVSASEAAGSVLDAAQRQWARSHHITPQLFYTQAWLKRTLAGPLSPR